MEKEMATHSSILAWKIPWMGEPGRLQSMGSQESDTTERLHFHFGPKCLYLAELIQQNAGLFLFVSLNDLGHILFFYLWFYS